ncbi:MAG: sulfatase [Verrucomicrobia bacterium]|jgi:arylsulfatase A-like enzyme|nr:sulfatase [Verrucomicrobiota bacterium]
MLLLRILFAFLLTLSTAISTQAAERMNVLFILVDDLGYMDIGAYNPNTFYETPNIDALANQGMRFTNGYAANPVCSPTRYSIMTGKHPTRVDATNFFAGTRPGKFKPAPLNDRMPLSETTLAEAFKEQGYATFFAGKWHLGPTEAFWPEHQGFDVNKGGWRAGGPFKAGKYFSPYANPRLKDGPEGEHLPARLASETIAFMNAHMDGNFLAYLSFYSVHTPLLAPKALVEKYQKKAERLGLTDHEAFQDEEQIWPNAKQSRKVRTLQAHAVYAAMMESMDTNVGRVLDSLVEMGIEDETIVCFMSDNGGLSTSEGSPTSNLPLRGGKGWIYEGGVREPYIIKWPGMKRPGSTSGFPVVSMDFYPTLLDLAGLPMKPEQHLDGVSLAPILKGNNAPKRESLFWHYPHYSNQGGFPGGAIRSGDWKLIERFEDGQTHLYNLRHDLGETEDLANQYPERTNEMRKDLHAWYQNVDAKFLQPMDKGPMPWRP